MGKINVETYDVTVAKLEGRLLALTGVVNQWETFGEAGFKEFLSKQVNDLLLELLTMVTDVIDELEK